MKNRCFGNKVGQFLVAQYHDKEWGIPSHDDRHLFELLVLEGAQAGLNWETILKKRDAYRDAFHNFDPKRVARMSDAELDALLVDSTIIRNRLKVTSARKNARVYLEIQEEFGSFDCYLWKWVDGKPVRGIWAEWKDVPCQSELSAAVSKDLKRRGMSFVGPKIIYSYLQAVGVLNDHIQSCWCCT
ncbi:MAG: DNA-3-methyladenine glycosylase I [Chlamydiia bacterium]|nr:DNA-3-methyladenine glycosylase I [Chlamydiia bacterium]